MFHRLYPRWHAILAFNNGHRHRHVAALSAGAIVFRQIASFVALVDLPGKSRTEVRESPSFFVLPPANHTLHTDVSGMSS